MARNIEIKTRIADLDTTRAAAVALGAHHAVTEEQEDRYYELDSARRVKLRTVAGVRAELIQYRRPEDEGVRTSDYEVTTVRDEEAGACRVPKGPPLVVVRKRREVLLLDNVRIHLDVVESLGTFLELEAVVDDVHDEECCRRQVSDILRTLGLSEIDLLRVSYSDMVPGGEGKESERS